MRRAVCPGSFDPVTNGHLDIVTRAARLFDEVVVAVGVNMSKSRLFTPDERIAMLEEATAGIDNVRVSGFEGLIVEFCREIDAVAIVKGLRGAGDYEYELPMAQMNSHLTTVETVFLPGAVGNAFVSSSLIKEVAALGGDVRGLVPDAVHDQLVRATGRASTPDRSDRPRVTRFAPSHGGGYDSPVVSVSRNRSSS